MPEPTLRRSACEIEFGQQGASNLPARAGHRPRRRFPSLKTHRLDLNGSAFHCGPLRGCPRGGDIKFRGATHTPLIGIGVVDSEFHSRWPLLDAILHPSPPFPFFCPPPPLTSSSIPGTVRTTVSRATHCSGRLGFDNGFVSLRGAAALFSVPPAASSLAHVHHHNDAVGDAGEPAPPCAPCMPRGGVA